MSVLVSENSATSIDSSAIVRGNPVFSQSTYDGTGNLDVVYSYQSIRTSTSESPPIGYDQLQPNSRSTTQKNDGDAKRARDSNSTPLSEQYYKQSYSTVSPATSSNHGMQLATSAPSEQHESAQQSIVIDQDSFGSGMPDNQNTKLLAQEGGTYLDYCSSNDPSSFVPAEAAGEVAAEVTNSQIQNCDDLDASMDQTEPQQHHDSSLLTGNATHSSWMAESSPSAGETPVLSDTNEQPPCPSQNSIQAPMVIEENNVLTTNDNRYNLTTTSVPRLLTSASNEFQGNNDENFLRGCKWSPDGSLVLTNSNDNRLRIFSPVKNMNSNGSNEQMVPKVKMKESSQIYDFAWHPKMSVNQTDYCRIACTCAGIPIHLWDSTTGQSVASYRAYDQYDEITAAYSLSFSLDGSKIYAGYNKAIRIFDTDYPVRSCKTVKTFNSQKKDGQLGIISCFTHSPDGNGLYVAGSYSRHIGIYDSACDRLVCLMQGQQGGVTHLMFSPDATKLYSGGRKDAEILCWDMRNMGRILFSTLRDVKTNQRMYFDLSQSGRYLVSGNHDGSVAFWDTLSPGEEVNGDLFLQPCSQFQAHRDCVNGVSFNHQRDILVTASGQRHFRNFDDYDSDDSDENCGMEEEPWDFSLRLWQIPFQQ